MEIADGGSAPEGDTAGVGVGGAGGDDKGESVGGDAVGEEVGATTGGGEDIGGFDGVGIGDGVGDCAIADANMVASIIAKIILENAIIIIL